MLSGQGDVREETSPLSAAASHFPSAPAHWPQAAAGILGVLDTGCLDKGPDTGFFLLLLQQEWRPL